jgi:microcystin-dependent protein
MDISQSVWNESDDNNNSASPDGAPEGMAPSGVNNLIRADRGAIKRWYNQTVPLLTGGSSTAYTLTYGVAPTALADGMTHLLQFNQTNGAAPTLNVNGLGAKPLHYHCAGAWRVIPTGLFDTDDIVRVAYNVAAGAYRLLGLKNRTGVVEAFAGTTAPAGALLCFAQAISRTDYVGLFTVIGTTFGVGDGSTTFNLPDLRGRVAAGKDNMGGSAANRLTGAGFGSGVTLGAAGGAETHVHSGSSTMDAPNLTTLVEGNAVGNPINVASQSHSHANVAVA